jgi:AcrR family transcriptional regulator
MPPPSPTSSADEPSVRRAGRPREEERDELRARRRQEIVAAAYLVFGEKGYKATGTADIAAHLGMGEGTIYRYFQNKREIVDHVLDYGVEQLVAAIQEIAPPEGASSIAELADQIRLIAREIFALFDRQPGLVRVLLEAMTIDEELSHRVVGLVETFGAFSASYLGHGVAGGFVRDDLDLQVLAQGLNALVLPVMLRAVIGPIGPDERQRYVETMVAFACEGLGPPAADRS